MAGEIVMTWSLPVREMTTMIFFGNLDCCLLRILYVNIEKTLSTFFTSPFKALAVLDFYCFVSVVQVAGTGVCIVAVYSCPLEYFSNKGVETCANNCQYLCYQNNTFVNKFKFQSI